MKNGRRLRPAPTLAEIRAQAKRDLERLPEPLRELEPVSPIPLTSRRPWSNSPPTSIVELRKVRGPLLKENLTIGERDVLLVVDIQNDFCPGGGLAVPRGDEVVPLINSLAAKFPHVVLTQDWHPRGHLSFASSHAGKQPFETIDVAYGRQILWPDHCVQGTSGAAFHADLSIAHAELVLRKGYHRNIDSYSAFYENDRRTKTGLASYLRERGFRRCFWPGSPLTSAFAIRPRMRAAKASRCGDSRMPAAASTSMAPLPRHASSLNCLASAAFRRASSKITRLVRRKNGASDIGGNG